MQPPSVEIFRLLGTQEGNDRVAIESKSGDDQLVEPGSGSNDLQARLGNSNNRDHFLRLRTRVPDHLVLVASSGGAFLA